MAPTFASAASQNSNATRESTEWSRRPNGATQTFRRPSGHVSATSSTQPQDASTPTQPPRYVPPHRNGAMPDLRYTRDQLLDLYKSQHHVPGALKDGLADLYVGGWRPDATSASAGSNWGKSEQSRDTQSGPDMCWDANGSIEPISLSEMDDEERELFTTSVNTPLKPPNTAKENQQSNGMQGGRKASMSGQATAPGAYGPLSPSTTRGSGRRRETNEFSQYPANPLSPSGTGFNREEPRAPSPPPSLVRRRTDKADTRDAPKSSERDSEGQNKSSQGPFASMKRTTTNPLSTAFGAPSSPWSNTPQSATMSPMGSFGNFGLGQTATSGDKRPSLATGGRAESRFKNVLNKDATEDDTPKPVERKTSMSNLSRVDENGSWRSQQTQDLTSSALDEGDEDLPSGNAELASGLRGFGTPARSELREDFGFGAFGMTSNNAQGLGHGLYHQTPAQQRQAGGGNEPMSPTDTNPYQSPDQHGIEQLTEDQGSDDIHNGQLPGLGGFNSEQAQHYGGLGGLGALPNLGRTGLPHGSAGDRSQTSSAGPNRAFPGLGPIGSLNSMSGAAAWPLGHGGIGTPTRQASGISSAFGSGFFAGGLGDVQSPGLSGLGGGGMLSPQGAYAGSRMGTLFPSAMQEQMRQAEQDYDRSGDSSTGPGESSRSLMEQERGSDQASGQFGAPGQPSQPQPPIGQSSQQSQESARSQPGAGQHQGPGHGAPSGGSASNQLPQTQQRTMVMPDRMRWIYRDPQGQTQGPWSGLEMHDWYKAGFFSPELLVKKYEDPEYEPLAQLIRRIGNSREPFLVPQIGIPHGQPSNNGPNAWAGSGPAGSAAGSGGAQPPFASSFPSFGTTLTAEQQNALERRKQEEQYLMARQKEHLAQAQIAQRLQQQQQIHHGSHPQHSGGLMPGSGQLQHHASAQSLHSQPSFGSMASPNTAAYQSSPNQGSQGQTPGFFDNSFRSPGAASGPGGAGGDNLSQIREEEIPSIADRVTHSGQAGQASYGASGQPYSSQQISEQHERQVQQMLDDRARLRQEQERHDATQSDQPVTNERLQQLQQLQGKVDSRFGHATGPSAGSKVQGGVGSPLTTGEDQAWQRELSLTEQVQKAASVQQSPAQAQSGFPQPFPPPAPSESPLPAPAAQRTGRQSVADQLQTEQRELSETSSADTPSAVAPWAKELNEASRGPSLKEIQEMEAKKAAEAEELASAARRAALQRELEAQVQAQSVVAPGLPASASWAAASPSASAAGNATAWAKAAQKVSGPAAAKSMAQIQKEEETRKKKLAAAAIAAQATATGGVASPVGGKSYANLAGKVAAPASAGGAWTTVGAGGKTKTPVTAPVANPTRAVSSGVVPSAVPAPVAAASPLAKKTPVKSSATPSAGSMNAQEEFRKWAVGELRPDLNQGIAADDFVGNLVALPQDSDIITEAVHGASSTIDSRHFAEEFIRRKKLADKGLVDAFAPPKSASPHTANVDKAGGWSEVAKKTKEVPASSSREETNGNFRVVQSKKKAGKR
ncbi:hypothetical protein BDY17DRAFT_39533 [Neohortaea acidophila]|uniref:GYF domain-containing protein n=1 Tax=Neohortaea acidophila TaxID=245834 RepID=A0A6A6PHK6_9PEZI|nr:uncharacterized protein BDY17DRAFT_39533 [Neohortaea acidophila]KAF2479480.1 hypothetical protein BDY17DRAFT_39533 [Neohortaea acidophila]